jgi:hypothetical protein
VQQDATIQDKGIEFVKIFTSIFEVVKCEILKKEKYFGSIDKNIIKKKLGKYPLCTY